MIIPAVYCARSDGLGARLVGLLAAMRVAQLLDVDFKFTWTGLSTWRMDFRAVNGHSIAAPNEFFAQSFIDRHLIGAEGLSDLPPELNEPLHLTLQDLRDRFDRDGGIRLTGVPPLDEICSTEFPPSTFAMRDCFDRIGFSMTIRNAIKAAEDVHLTGPMSAFHLRGGDIVYGSWRKRVRWTYKSLPIPIAKAAIESAREQGKSVVCFGTDAHVVDYLSTEYGAVNGSALAAKFDTEAERAMFEISLMSRASEIIAGTSAFAKVAASLDRIPIFQPERVIDPERRQSVCIEDLMVNADTYDRLQTAFSYWYLYYDGRRHRSSRANIEWLNKAQEYDPDNKLYALVKAALLYKIEADDEAERVVECALADDTARGEREVLEVLVGQTNREQNLREYQPYFRDAWLRGRPFGSVLHAAVERAKGNDQECQRILGAPAVRRSVGHEILGFVRIC